MIYGRRQGRLKPAQKDLLQNALPEWELKTPSGAASLRGNLGFNRTKVEIGFGAGEHLAFQARNFPEDLFIGCEPFLNGVAGLVEKIHSSDIKNIRIFKDNGLLLLEQLPACSVEALYILFPDPWPKKRHHKRRLVCAENMKIFTRVLCPGAEMLVATDHEGYQKWIAEMADRDQEEGAWQIKSSPPPLWVPTRYSVKARNQGRNCLFFTFKKA